MDRRVLAGLLALVLAAAAGCSKPEASGRGEKPVDGGTLTLGLVRGPGRVVNPLVAGESEVTRLIFSGLLKAGPRWEPVCDLCETYSVSLDQRTVTFTLRQGVRWHDGQPFTSADVAFTLRLLLHPEYSGPQAGHLTALSGVQPLLDQRDALLREVAEGRLTAAEAAKRRMTSWDQWLKGPGAEAITTPDERTVVLRLAEPYGPLLTQLMVPMLPVHQFGQVGVGAMKEHEASRRPVGTGPYRLVENRPGEQVKLERHEAYHGGRPRIPTVVVRIVRPAAVAGALQAGQLDYAAVPPEAAGALRDDPQVFLVERMGFGYQYLGLNHDLPLFADRRVRQALLQGIDREGMVEKRLLGHGMVVNSPLAPIGWVSDGVELRSYPYDEKRAATLLAEAGWQERNAGGWLVRDGKPFAFTLKVPQGNPVREASAAQVRDDLAKLGIKVTLETVEFGQLVRDVFGQRSADAWLLGWDVPADPDPGPAYLSDNKWGRATGWSSAPAEQILRQAARKLGSAERRPLYVQWSRLVNEELPVLYLYAENQVEGVRAGRVKGVKPDPRGLLWNVWEWWIPKAQPTGG